MKLLGAPQKDIYIWGNILTFLQRVKQEDKIRSALLLCKAVYLLYMFTVKCTFVNLFTADKMSRLMLMIKYHWRWEKKCDNDLLVR